MAALSRHRATSSGTELRNRGIVARVTWIFADVAARVGLPRIVSELASGNLPVGEVDPGATVPFSNDGFPPALWPMWNTGESAFVGVWVHWLVNRHPTFVELELEDSTVEEIATDVDQLFHWMAYDVFEWCDDDSEVVSALMAAIGGGHVDVAAVEALRGPGSVGPEDLAVMPAFATNPPRAVAGPTYTGPFPVGTRGLDRACSFELQPDVRLGVAVERPPWLVATEQLPVFSAELAAGRLDRAWLSLNSSGWLYADAVDALNELAARAAVPELSAVAVVWTQLQEGRHDGF